MSSRIPPRHLLALALAAFGLALGGCGDDAASSGGNTVNVVPSLGLVRNAEVRVLDLGGQEIGRGTMGANGNIIIAADTRNGFIVELSGGDGVTYYDEGMQEWRPLPAGTTLHAVSAGDRNAVAVTALTEIAYQRALVLTGNGPIDAPAIAQANGEMAAWLANVPVSVDGAGNVTMPDEVPDILAPADLVSGPVTLDSSTPAGRYAILLASLSDRAHDAAVATGHECLDDDQCTPLLPLIAYLATDFADGVLDEHNPFGTSNGLPFIEPDDDDDTGGGDSGGGDTGGGHDGGETDTGVHFDDPTPQQEIAMEFHGNYTLTCAGDVATTQMTVGEDGQITLAGPHGDFHFGLHDRTVKDPLLEHTYTVNLSGKGFVLRSWHMEAGEPYYDKVLDHEIVAHAGGTVALKLGAVERECTTTFTVGDLTPPIPAFTQRLAATSFICTKPGGGPVQLGTLSFTATTFTMNDVLQPERLSDFAVYKHQMFQQLQSGDTVSTYEHYQWGTSPFEGSYVDIMRAGTRWEVPTFNTFDFQATGGVKQLTNCSPEGPDLPPEMFEGEGGIVIDFGGTELTL